MKDDILKESWEGIGSHINPSSMEEIEKILKRRTKKVTDSFLLASVTGIIVYPIFFVALFILMLNRWDDVFFRFNNMFLCTYTVYKFYNSITAFYRIRYIGPNLPLKVWLKRWTDYKRKFGTARSVASILFIPILMASLYLSIYLFITKETVSEILYHPSFSIGFLAGLIVARIIAILIRRKKQLNQLQYLEDLYNEMCDLEE